MVHLLIAHFMLHVLPCVCKFVGVYVKIGCMLLSCCATAGLLLPAAVCQSSCSQRNSGWQQLLAFARMTLHTTVAAGYTDTTAFNATLLQMLYTSHKLLQYNDGSYWPLECGLDCMELFCVCLSVCLCLHMVPALSISVVGESAAIR